jgi:oligopeptide/dipeptide ABC transporter ATP-binding protein
VTVQAEIAERGPATGDDGPLLEVSDLSVVFGSRPPAEAVRGVSLAVGRGEACGLVGESGSGKTSLAAALLGVLPAGGGVVAGSAQFDGLELTRLDEPGWRAIRGRRIAMVFQEASMALDPLMTVGGHLREALLLGSSLRGRAADAGALELVHEVGISDPERRLRQYPHELSGGMRQRVLIALALSGDPELLIADEPTTALDVTVQAQILELLRARQVERGMAMLLISHSLPVVASVVDRVFVMYGGRIMEAGPVRELFRAPRHPYTAALLVANPDVDRDLELRPIPGSPPSAHRLPPGCPFAPRCPHRQTRCDERAPELVRVGPEHELSCVVDPFRRVSAEAGR